MDRVRIDLHCHSSASFDGHVDPIRLVNLALERGLTHLAITDHDVIDGARGARDVAPAGLTVIVGQEARTTEGDLIALFVFEPVPSGLTPTETAERIRAQGGLVGLPHPFDVRRPSIGRGAARREDLARLAELVDYVEVHNGRVLDPAINARAADFAREYRLPGVAASDSHSEPEVGTVATVLTGPIESADDLRTSLGRGGSLHVRPPEAAEPRGIGQIFGRLRNR